MKKMQQIPEVQKRIRMTTTFSGYNHQEIISDGEMYDTTNLTGDQYPVLATRRKRGVASYDPEGSEVRVPLTAVHGRDQLVLIRGQDVFYNNYKVPGLQVSDDPGMLPKKIVSMGAYVCIWPDKVYFNTVDLTDCGGMERRFTISGDTVTASMCRGDGTNYDMTTITQSVTPPENPANGDLWLDMSGDNDVLRQYNVSTMEWVEVPSVYVKISGTGIGNGLREYDTIEIAGIEAPDEAADRTKAQAQALNGSKIVYAAGNDYIVIQGLLNNSLNELKETTVSVNRTVPDLDFICESNNRLWGCKYGLENGVVVNEIRASKLGDFRNWGVSMGLSTDSYTASIGTDGRWTGAISQRGYPVFFKENAIHRVSGNTPSSFGIQTTIARGVQEGSWRSVCVVNEAIYYKSRDGIMLYDGNMPVSVSEALGGILYSDGRAGALKDKYYISMKDAGEHFHLFTYDTKRSVWYREDCLKALQFATVQDELYAIDEEHNTLLAMTGSTIGDLEGYDTEEEEDVVIAESEWQLETDPEWEAVFGISGMDVEPLSGGYGRSDVAGSHYLSRFDIRMSLEAKHSATLEIMYDNDGRWTDQGTIHGTKAKNIVLPVIPKRCDHLRFRMKGTGAMRIYSIARHVEVGADG